MIINGKHYCIGECFCILVETSNECDTGIWGGIVRILKFMHMLLCNSEVGTMGDIALVQKSRWKILLFAWRQQRESSADEEHPAD